jgi:hypothetical protein
MALDLGKLQDVVHRLAQAGGDQVLTDTEYKLLGEAFAGTGYVSVARSIQLLKDRPLSTLIEAIVGAYYLGEASVVCPPSGTVFTAFKLDSFDMDQGAPGVPFAPSLSFPFVTRIGSYQMLWFSDLLTVAFPELIGNLNLVIAPQSQININRCNALTSISIPKMDFRQWSTVDFSNNPALTTIDVSASIWGPNAGPFTSPPLDASNCALTEACVDAI